MLVFIGPLGTSSIKSKLSLIFKASEKMIYVTSIPFSSTLMNQNKNFRSLQNLILALIRQNLLEVSILFCNKLKLIGVGYKGFSTEIFNTKLLQLRLGYSHQIYFNPPLSLKINCHKSVNLFIWGHSYQTVMQISSIIRSYKSPEPYKGKGILYENEKIQLKEGKKV